ncbi:unnamed protein product, partial [Iphiclides podalirius]
MGAKASTANGGQSPRARTFSTSSSSDVVSGGAGFSLLRAIPANSQSYEASAAASPDTDSSSNEEAGPGPGTSLALGRVYAAHSLPSHIWSINDRVNFSWRPFLLTLLPFDGCEEFPAGLATGVRQSSPAPVINRCRLFRVRCARVVRHRSVSAQASSRAHVPAMYRRRYRATLGLGLGSSFSSTFSTTLSFRSSTATDSVRSDARATAAKLKSKYESAGTAQGAFIPARSLPPIANQ